MNWKKYVIEKYLGEEGSNYVEFKSQIKRKIFEDLLSEDESRILTGAKVLIHLDNLNYSLEEFRIIENKCRVLPKSKRKMMRDYREDVKAGLLVIKNFVTGNKCKCGIYQKWVQFLPEREVEMGFLKLESEPKINKEKYQKEFELKCLKCGTTWQSNEIYGYHYPWYEWKRS